CKPVCPKPVPQTQCPPPQVCKPVCPEPVQKCPKPQEPCKPTPQCPQEQHCVKK
ncbi:Hypothetical predicted protein, partial [Pelobates cultripes]